MTEQEEDQIAYWLLGVLQKYAPDTKAQEQCAEIYRQMEADGLSSRQKVTQLSGAILDGTNLGNWPWTDYQVPPAT